MAAATAERMRVRFFRWRAFCGFLFLRFLAVDLGLAAAVVFFPPAAAMVV